MPVARRVVPLTVAPVGRFGIRLPLLMPVRLLPYRPRPIVVVPDEEGLPLAPGRIAAAPYPLLPGRRLVERPLLPGRWVDAMPEPVAGRCGRLEPGPDGRHAWLPPQEGPGGGRAGPQPQAGPQPPAHDQ